MVRGYTTSRGSQSLDGEALDRAKQQLKLAVKKGYGTILERFDNDVEYILCIQSRPATTASSSPLRIS